MGHRPFTDRIRSLYASVDRWMSETLAGAVEADLRDAGYEVLGRSPDGAVVWIEPAATAAVVPGA